MAGRWWQPDQRQWPLAPQLPHPLTSGRSGAHGSGGPVAGLNRDPSKLTVLVMTGVTQAGGTAAAIERAGDYAFPPA
jgi:hypothetical protein